MVTKLCEHAKAPSLFLHATRRDAEGHREHPLRAYKRFVACCSLEPCQVDLCKYITALESRKRHTRLSRDRLCDRGDGCYNVI